MAVRWYSTGGQRYYVISTRGCTITPSGQSIRDASSYAVLDRDYNHREVGSFYVRKGATERLCRKRAEELADRLNRRERLGHPA